MGVSQGDSPIKAEGISSHSDQSSNLSDCSQVLQYLNCPDALLSANLLPAIGIGDGRQAFPGSASVSATSASSITTEGNSLISGTSTLRQSMTTNADSMASTGAGSMGLPTSPLSFSSSNVSLPGSSSFSITSLSQSSGVSLSRLEAHRDPNMHPTKLLKSDGGHLSLPMGEVADKSRWQYDANNVDINPQSLNSSLTGRFDPQMIVQGLIGPRHEFHRNEQHLAQLQASMSATKVMQKDFLQQQAAQQRFHRANPLSTAQIQRHDTMQQPQHVHSQLLQQQLLQQEHLLRMLPPQTQRTPVLLQQQQQQQHLLQQQQLQQQLQLQVSKQAASAILGSCSRRLMQYMHHQRMRPADNNISFWRAFVSEFFTPFSRKRWCLSKCSTGGGRQQSNGIFPQELWCCELCGSSPGRGFEVTMDIMPRLCKTKFDNGELEELLFVDHPREYRLSSGLIVLEYNKAVQESIYEQLRVVWEGQLRVIFTAELKILSWDFCTKNHDEFLPRRSIVPQVNQLVTLASRYQSAMAQSNGNGLSVQDLQAICKVFVSSANQLTNSLEPPCVNELGFTKRFVRGIQIAEVMNSLKDLIDFSQANKLGPIEGLSRFLSLQSSAGVVSLGKQSKMGQVAMPENLPSSYVQARADEQRNMFNGPVNVHTNVMQLPHILQQSSGSYYQGLTDADTLCPGTPSAVGATTINSFQASPTSSLTSYQTSLSSLTTNSQQPGASLQNSLMSCGPSNMNLLQQQQHHVQQPPTDNDPSTNLGSVQQFLQGMMNSQVRSGSGLYQRSGGISGLAGNKIPEGLMLSGPARNLLGFNMGGPNLGGTGGRQ